MLYFSDVSDVLLQSIFKLNDDEKLSTSITISESQLVIMVKFNPMIELQPFGNCNHSASYDDFSILTRDNSKFVLELKESMLILRDKPSLNRNITSAPLYLFDKA